MAKKKQERSKRNEAPFSAQIASYTEERLQQTRTLLERQRADLQQRWARLEHAAQGHLSLHQVRDIENRIALVDRRLLTYADHSKEMPATEPETAGVDMKTPTA